MATRTYTPSQQQAIDSSGHNILVSASAGSGKTSVLVERVIQKIINGEDVDRLLVVTFTEAAAAEMKERIRAAIMKKTSEVKDADLQNHLSLQLGKLNNANISTLHAFCMAVIRNYYYVIDLDPAFRIMDPTESELLKEQVWADLREELYESDEDGQFARLTRNFSNDRSDAGLQELMLDLFEFANANPDPEAWLTKIANNYEVQTDQVMEMDFVKQILAKIKTQLIQIYQTDLNLTERAINGGEPLQKAAANFQAEVAGLKTVIDQFDQPNWDALQQAMVNFKFAQLPRGKKPEVQEFNLEAKPLRNEFKAEFNGLVERYFKLKNDQLIAIFKDARELMLKLIEVQQQFSDRFLQEKLTRRSLDFSDLEHFALQILQNQSEEGQAVRRNFQEKFNEVIVDEYQDINPLQETILTAVAREDPGNMFMVGDVKQSIYAFRMADPSLFISKSRRFKQSGQPDERIILAENFRSMQNVDDFTNLIFNQIMDQAVGEIAYDADAQLKFGAKYYPAEVQNDTEVLLFDDQQNENTADQEPGAIITDKNDGQLQMIAQRIKRLFADQTEVFDRDTQEMRPLKYSDIALLHSTGNNNLNIVDTFKKYGIPIEVSNAQDYFQTTEVSIMMALLKIIDNPYQDIPLAAVLRSPIVGLDENELAFLRISKKNGHYFESVLYFQNEFKIDYQNEFQANLKRKIDQFLDQLQHFRKLSQQCTLVDLLWEIYQETGYLDYVGGMPDGPQRQNNLHALYDADHGFNNSDTKGRYVLDRDAGMGITVKDFVHRLEVDTMQKNWIIDVRQRKMLAEELRVLYVALTRAQQKLIITGALKAATPTLEKWAQAADTGELLLPEAERGKAKNFLDWIGMAIMRVPSVTEDYPDVSSRKLDSAAGVEVKLKVVNRADLLAGQRSDTGIEQGTPPTLEKVDVNSDINDAEQIRAILNFKYHDIEATQTTAYQSVSEIKRVFDDPDKLEMDFSAVDRDQKIRPQKRFVTDQLMTPRFMSEVSQPKPTEIGTATHLILQQLDLREPVTEAVIKDKIRELVMNQVLEEAVAKRIRINSILDFFESELGQLMLAHPEQVHREEAFSLLLPAKGLFPNVVGNQDVLIHGIIDAYFELDGRVILLDYKTDFVLPGSPQQGIQKVIDRYQGQVNLYAQALSNILGKPVNEKYLYLLSIGKLVEIQ